MIALHWSSFAISFSLSSLESFVMMMIMIMMKLLAGWLNIFSHQLQDNINTSKLAAQLWTKNWNYFSRSLYLFTTRSSGQAKRLNWLHSELQVQFTSLVWFSLLELHHLKLANGRFAMDE